MPLLKAQHFTLLTALLEPFLTTLPLELRLRGKSTTQSHRAPIYYVDLTIRTGMTLMEAITHARTESDLRKASGFDQAALDDAARLGFGNGAFEDSEEDDAAVVEEFYSDRLATDKGSSLDEKRSEISQKLGLSDKLDQKFIRLNGNAQPTAQATTQ